MENLTVSIVVPAYNCEKTIADCLTAIKSQTYRNIKEVIVVDDGSTDKTSEIVKSFSRPVYLRQENSGPAKARNAGAKKASGEVIFFTDSDCVPRENWIETAIKGFKDNEVAAVMGSYDIANPQFLLSRCIHKEIIFRHNSFLPQFPKVFGSYNVVIRREIFEKLGGFNESYRYASGEDNDLSYRILKNNYKIYFERESKVKHFHQHSFLKYLLEQYRHGYWRAKLYFSHPDMAKGDNYTFWKDMIEVPLVFFILVFLVVNVLSPGIYDGTLAFFVLALYLLNLIFAFLFTHDFFESIYYSFVMYVRSFARTFGMSTGIVSFFLPK